uniref:Bifunctional glutamine synthetase adenylyltransferase/adenylyl-removing enzyme n=1 Tax=Magnetococcus massalia (strain MO-1) TaxID=451514 RepID=A0A1S7LH35_MAGMO|nr:Putative glutamine synthetase adenylyltransferase [Candidatus Magnetococcus massalia]
MTETSTALLSSQLIQALNLDQEAQDHLTELIATTAEPDHLNSTLEQCLFSFLDTPEDPRMLAWQEAMAHWRWRRRIILALGNSPFLSNILRRWPEFLMTLQQRGIDWQAEPYKQRVIDDLLGTEDREEAERRLRVHKHLSFLDIGMRDLTGEAPLEETTEHLSLVAEATLEAAYQWLERYYEGRFGKPMAVPEEGGEERRVKFVILGMGKFGAYELNFSSDIDLIFLFDHDNGMTDGKQCLSIKAYYVKMGRDLMSMMSKQTKEGMVFRTDLRLRPEGEAGELSLSVRSAETYYESWGQTWERSAMIKARPVAGDMALGNTFLKNLHPFVYRRFLDFGALESIRDMKKKIDHKVNNQDAYGKNIKLGFGGIREIEFFAQSHQLIHAGRIKTLQDRRTCPVLESLADLGLIERSTADTLISAYRFLRTVEHRIQIVREQQTHNLPDDALGMQQLSRRMGMMDLNQFEEKLDRVRGQVHAAYDDLFFEADRQVTEEGGDERVRQLMGTSTDHQEQETKEHLAELGFEFPDQALERLNLFKQGPDAKKHPLTEAGQRSFSRLVPLMLKHIFDAPDPDLALQHTEQFLQQILQRTNYLALLVENPALLSIIMPIFGSSTFLSRHLINHPRIMDSLVGLDFITTYRGNNEMRVELAEKMNSAEDSEERFDELRMFRNTEMLRLGMRDLAGFAELQEVMAGLSSLAMVVLEQACMDAMSDLMEKHGKPMWGDADGQQHRARFMVVAMGKLGGDELNYSSDLDLIFVHTSGGDDQWTDGPKQVSNTQFFARMAQKVIGTLTAFSAGGRLYEIDMRLRPSGSSGPVVTSLEAFEKYQQEEAWTWEHQALSRAHVVVGHREDAKRMREIIQTILLQPRETDKLCHEVAEMRQRMFEEKRPPEGVIDIKQAPGGIVDIEFLIQYLILAHAHDTPTIIQRNANRALMSIKRAGLIDKETFVQLDEAYRFYRLVENRLRLLHDRSENCIKLDEKLTNRRLAHLCSLESDQLLIDRLQQHFAAVRPIYTSFLPQETEP